MKETMGIQEVISAISKGIKGDSGVIIDDKIADAVSDGDICRAFEKYGGNFLNLKAEAIMSGMPKAVCQDEMIVEAEKIMHESGIVSLLVCGVLAGIV